MSIETPLMQRADSKCELCGASEILDIHEVAPVESGNVDKAVLLCDTCRAQLEADKLDPNHWRCLNDSMWSQVPAVQVMAFRQLKRLTEQGETWAQDLLDMLYLDEETLAWAEAGLPQEEEDDREAYDSNGTRLYAGDTVHLIKDLDVKGGGFTAKRGTAVRNIGLTNSPDQIEGRVNGVRIVLLTKFLKKS